MRKLLVASSLTTLWIVLSSPHALADTVDGWAWSEPRSQTLTFALAGGLPLLVIAALGSLLIARRASRAQQPVPATQIPMAAPVSRKQITEIHESLAVLREVGEAGTAYPLEGSMIRIGRHGDNDIQLASQTVHRYHAVLHVTPRQSHVLTDLSGPEGNGVLVNGHRIEQAELTGGDVIELGDVKLCFELSDAA